ncbi:hypothetical protein NLJ89_g4819 [Agrocybe chaxingu]|uniref:F-box domain-containing protein n=1 Tax=Agrocybe chaxingu TaxID=84603 RepID=A0A9W8K219_9AGAR|nr:hypothetical protein NLJ89_g4819 [Agrocybe chaxingu]
MGLTGRRPKQVLPRVRRHIHDLPPELIRRIFVLCLPENPYTRVIARVTINEAPLLLCKICSSWRSVALGMPDLWRNIQHRISQVATDDGDRCTSQPSVDVVDHWLERCQHTPTAVRLDFAASSLESAMDVGLVPLHRLLTSRGILNARNIELRAERLEDLQCIRSIDHREVFYSAESLAIFVQQGLPNSHPPSSFPPSPHLRRLFIRNYLQDYFSPIHLFPWAQLTHLISECYIGPTTWRTTNGRTDKTAGDVTMSLTLPLLRRLTVLLVDNIQRDGRIVDNLLVGLEFPNLDFLQISSCSTEVHVYNWANLFSQAPAVKTLHIGPYLSFSHSPFLSSLDTHLPKLHTLTLDLSTEVPPLFAPFSPQLFADFITSRSSASKCHSPSPSPITHFALAYTEGNPSGGGVSKMLDALRAVMADDGFEVDVAINPPYQLPSPPDNSRRWYEILDS